MIINVRRRLHASRRSPAIAALTCAAVTLAASASTAAADNEAAAEPAQHTPVRLTLPEPTGPHHIGKTVLHLTDPSRREPWVPSHPFRTLMISIWYPAQDATRHPTAPYMPAASGAEFLANDTGLHPGQAELPLTHAHVDAPVDRHCRKIPVVVYVTGKNATRDNTTVIDEDLASHGYIVVTIDFPYDAGEVEFPDGHIVNAIPDSARGDGSAMLAERVADTSFVLNQLDALSHGADPDTDHHPVPRGLAEALDLTRIGLFGHSLGGVNVASSMYADSRFDAGMDIDGGAEGPVVQAGLDRPFLIVDGNKSSRATLPDYQTFWTHLHRWHRDIALLGSGHDSFTDLEAFYPQLAQVLPLPTSELVHLFGTIAPARAVAWQQTYPRAFADQMLTHHRRRVLNQPSSRFPEIVFIP